MFEAVPTLRRESFKEGLTRGGWTTWRGMSAENFTLSFSIFSLCFLSPDNEEELFSCQKNKDAWSAGNKLLSSSVYKTHKKVLRWSSLKTDGRKQTSLCSMQLVTKVTDMVISPKFLTATQITLTIITDHIVSCLYLE